MLTHVQHDNIAIDYTHSNHRYVTLVLKLGPKEVARISIHKEALLDLRNVANQALDREGY